MKLIQKEATGSLPFSIRISFSFVLFSNIIYLKIFSTGSGDTELGVNVGLLVIEMRDTGNMHIMGKARNQF